MDKKVDTFLQGKSGKKLNILVVGATGVGKSSTINALFNTGEHDVFNAQAKVGTAHRPQTNSITNYPLGDLIIWDSPGLGDSIEKDEKYSTAIRDLLQRLDENNKPLIDLALVILDGSHRDLGTTYQVLINVILKYLGEEPEKRIVIGLNKVDKIEVDEELEGWDKTVNKPTVDGLNEILKMQTAMLERLVKDTGISLDSVPYKAGSTSKKGSQKPWNISDLLVKIVEKTPEEQRVMLDCHMSKDASMNFYSDGSEEAKKLLEEAARLHKEECEANEKRHQERMDKLTDELAKQNEENDRKIERMREAHEKDNLKRQMQQQAQIHEISNKMQEEARKRDEAHAAQLSQMQASHAAQISDLQDELYELNESKSSGLGGGLCTVIGAVVGGVVGTVAAPLIGTEIGAAGGAAAGAAVGKVIGKLKND